MTDIAPLASSSTGRVAGSTGYSRVDSDETQNAPSRGIVRSSDRVELSELAKRLASNPESIRADKVNEARAKIEAGTLDTPETFASALDAMIEDLRDIP